MALEFRITNAVASALADAFDDAVNAGTAALIRIYDGTIPATADTALGAQVLLAELTMSATAFGAASNGVITAASITSDSSADATGTASWFLIITQDAGTVICMGSVGTGTNDLVVNTTAFTAGSTVSISSMTVTMPKS